MYYGTTFARFAGIISTQLRDLIDSHLQTRTELFRWLALTAIVIFCGHSTILCADVFDMIPAGARRHDLIVKFRDSGNPADKTHAVRNAASVEPIGPKLVRQSAGQASRSGLHLLTIQPQVDLGAEIARLQKNPAVEFVE